MPEGVRQTDGPATERQRGQALVLVALSIVVILGLAALAFDFGRFYSEKRFLQNAADAAALAAANSLIQGNSPSQADTDARTILTRDLAGSPTGSNPQLPPSTPVYSSGHAGDPTYLINGILITGGDVRVALQSNVSWTLARALGFTSNLISARAHVLMTGNMLPIAVRQFINAPGPANDTTTPCADDPNDFLAFFATAATACLGTDTDASLRTDPSAGSAFDFANPGSDPSEHGPIVAILGQGAQPDNGADFRGFIALDIRNFQDSTSQLYYNDVAPSTNQQTLKQMEANWIALGGYPGPGFPSATAPPDPNDQVAIMSGNDTGIAIDEVNQHFFVGENVLVAVYPGQTMEIPDFSMTSPATINLPVSGTVATAGSFKVSRNQAFSGTVTMSAVPDANDAANPLTTGALTGTSFSPNPVTPSLGSGQTVQILNMTTTGATPGIYTIWAEGQAGSPYLTTKYDPVSLNVGGVTQDFTITADQSTAVAANPGDSVTFTLNLKRVGSSPWPATPSVNLSLGGPAPNGSLPSGLGAVTFGASPVRPSSGTGTSVTLTINTGTLPSGEYGFVVRASGLNGDSPAHVVTHLLPLTVDVGSASAGGSQQYVDIVGWALMRITYMDTNYVNAYAITPVIPDMNDPRLLQGQVAKLAPWN